MIQQESPFFWGGSLEIGDSHHRFQYPKIATTDSDGGTAMTLETSHFGFGYKP